MMFIFYWSEKYISLKSIIKSPLFISKLFQQDGLYLGENEKTIKPASFGVSPRLQGTFSCEIWKPNSPERILSSKILITLQRWQTIVLSLNVDENESIPSLGRSISTNFNNNMLYNNNFTMNFIERVPIETKLDEEDDYEGSGDGDVGYAAKFHLYFSESQINLDDESVMHDLVEQTNDYFQIFSPVLKRITHCTEDTYQDTNKNDFVWPASAPGAVYSISKSCIDSQDRPVPRICRWNYKDGANYDQFYPSNCSRLDACPRGYTYVLNNYCVMVSKRDIWKRGLEAAFTTGHEVSIIDVLSHHDKNTITYFWGIINDFVEKIYRNESVIWLPIKRISKMGPFIDISPNSKLPLVDNLENIELKLTLTFDNISKESENCVALDLKTKTFSASDCNSLKPFVSIVNMSSLITPTKHKHSFIQHDSKCVRLKGLDPRISLHRKTCIFVKNVTYSSYEQAKELCNADDSKLPQPWKMFMNWEYKNILSYSNLASIYVDLTNRSMNYTNWHINTDYNNVIGVMDKNGWNLINDTNASTRDVLICEASITDHSIPKISFRFDVNDQETYVDLSNIDNHIVSSLRCYINGRSVPDILDNSVNIYNGVLIKSNTSGVIQCTIWTNNPVQYISSEPILRTPIESIHAFVVMLHNEKKIFKPSLRDNIYRDRESILKETELDDCEKSLFKALKSSATNEISFVSMEHNSFKNMLPQYLGVKFQMAQSINLTEQELLNDLSVALRDDFNNRPSCSVAAILSTVGCGNSELREPVSQRVLNWSSTTHSGNFKSIELCIIGSTGIPLTRKCAGDFSEGFMWSQKLDGHCTKEPKPTTLRLHEIKTKKPNISLLPEITNDVTLLEPASVSLIVDIFNNVIDATFNDENSDAPELDSVIHTMNNILAIDGEKLSNISKKLNTTNQLLESFQKIAFRGNGKQEKTYNEISVKVETFSKENKSITFSKSLENKINSNKENSNKDEERVEAAVAFPDNFISNLNISNVNILFAVYKHDKLFVEPSRNKSIHDVNSPIVQISVEETEVQNLEKPIVITFSLTNEYISECHYWDYSKHNHTGGWSREGCWKANSSKTHMICNCNHLTSFSLLTTNKIHLGDYHDNILSNFTYFGCYLSMFGFFFVLLTFSFSEKWRKRLTNKIMFQLSIASLLSLTIFMGGISQTDSNICQVVAVFLHYSLLVSFHWMLIEGIHQYLTFVRLNKRVPRFMFKAAIFSWGLSLVPIIVMLVLDKIFRLIDYVGNFNDGICWISPSGLNYAFIPQLLIVMCINSIIFIQIICTLCTPVKMDSTASRDKQIIQILIGSICLFFLMGLTWIFGLISRFDDTLISTYIFEILNSFQGFFIFLLRILGSPEIRKKLSDILTSVMEPSVTSSSAGTRNTTEMHSGASSTTPRRRK